MEELASADLWWNGPEFMKKSRQHWPECKFDKPTSTENLELKGTKESGTKDATSYQIIGEGEETASVKGVWQLDPSRYSKWYRVKTKRRTGNWDVFSSCDSMGAPIYRQL